MIRTKQKSRYCLLALLALLAVSCQKEEIVSTKDTLPWTINQHMDAENYRPGDDFYLYCNGKYWNNAPMGKNSIVGFFDTEMPEALNKLKASVTNPVYEQLKSHEEVQVTNEQFYAFLKPFYQKIDSIQNYQDAFRVAAELKKAGAHTIFNVSPISTKTISFQVTTSGPFDVHEEYKAFLEDDAPDSIYKYTATHPADYDDMSAYYDQLFYWDDHEEESAEYDARTNELVQQYLIPALGLDAEDLYYEYGFKNWLLLSVDELKAYLKMKVFQNYAPFANRQGFDFTIERTREYKSVYDYATSKTSLMKKYLDNRLVIERYISPELKKEVENLCGEIRDAFCTRINNLSWMSSTTKASAIRKVNAIRFYVGYPDQWIANFPDLSHCTNMLEDIQLIYKENTLMNMKLVGSSSKENEMNIGVFYSRPLLYDFACYDPEYNIVLIYTPYILPPMYDKNMHPAMKYGMLMSVIGHELTHALSLYGSERDENGNKTDWWTIQDRMEYESLQQRMVELYNRFTPLPDYPDIHTDGANTLDENIADLGGLEIAHDAFVAYCLKQGFFGEELDEMERKFFQSYAEYYRSRYGYDFYTIFKDNEHALDKERVNGVVMNIDRWYELFNVQWGDYLYLKPENRIHIW